MIFQKSEMLGDFLKALIRLHACMASTGTFHATSKTWLKLISYSNPLLEHKEVLAHVKHYLHHPSCVSCSYGLWEGCRILFRNEVEARSCRPYPLVEVQPRAFPF